MSLFSIVQMRRKKTNLMTAGDTMTLLTIFGKMFLFILCVSFFTYFTVPMSPVVMGVTSTVVYMLPFLSLPLTAAARCYILALIQVTIYGG